MVVTDSAERPARAGLGGREPVLIIGAGPAGLAAAAEFGRLGVPAEVLECGVGVATSWRQRYDRLRMNTCRWNVMLWFGRFPKGTHTFPTRDEFVDYLESYASKNNLRVHFGVKVERIDRVADGWRLTTSAGERTAGRVIVATGKLATAKMPEWPGCDRFPGRLLHSTQYRNAREFRGADVLVVGSGCSAMDIAGDLLQGGAGKVRIAIRTQPNLVMRTSAWGPNDLLAALLGHMPTNIADSIDGFIRHRTVGDLTLRGLTPPDERTFAALRRGGSVPTIIDPDVVQAIKDGLIEMVAAVSSVDAKGVRLANGISLRPDAVIAATGFGTGLEPLVGHLGVLDDQGAPCDDKGTTVDSGLGFLGYKNVGVIGRGARQETRELCQALARAR